MLQEPLDLRESRVKWGIQEVMDWLAVLVQSECLEYKDRQDFQVRKATRERPECLEL